MVQEWPGLPGATRAVCDLLLVQAVVSSWPPRFADTNAPDCRIALGRWGKPAELAGLFSDSCKAAANGCPR
jgi:hypothetical protein